MPDEKKDVAFVKVNPRGRPETISYELIEKICNSMANGAYVETAAVLNGISKVILYKWFKKGNVQKRGIYRDLVNAVQAAMAQGEENDLKNISHAAQGQDLEFAKTDDGHLVLTDGKPIVAKPPRAPNWQASAWRLERKFPRKWGRLDRIENSGKDGGPIVVVTLPSNGRENNKPLDENENDDDGEPGSTD